MVCGKSLGEMSEGDNTFMRVTNVNIYDELKLGFKINREEHAVLKEHAMETNGKVKLNRWISTTAMSIILILMGYMVNHIMINHP